MDRGGLAGESSSGSSSVVCGFWLGHCVGQQGTLQCLSVGTIGVNYVVANPVTVYGSLIADESGELLCYPTA